MKVHLSHKIVRAAPMMAVERTGAGAPWRVTVQGGEVIEAPYTLFARNGDVPPDGIGTSRAPVLIRYEDGFLSWSPRKAFDEGYAEVGTDSLSFGEAIELMRGGMAVRRSGWNGKGMWVAITPGNPALPAENFWNASARAFAIANGGSAEVLPSVIMRTADGKIVMGWLASQTDMLARDWELVSDEAAS